VPALVVSLTAPLDWLRNVAAYDGFTTANLPVSMTGLRHMIWEVAQTDVSNPVIMGIAVVVLLCACFVVAGGGKARNMFDLDGLETVLLATVVTLAVAPLHIYDFAILGVLLFPLAKGRPGVLALAAVGAALIWRAGDLALLTGFYDHDTEHFEGSLLATIGAILWFAAVLIFLREQRTVNHS